MALCVSAATRLHMDVGVWHQVSVQTLQVHCAVAKVGLLAAATGLLLGGSPLRVPAGEGVAEGLTEMYCGVTIVFKT